MSEMIERVAEAIRLRAIERGFPIHPVMVLHLAAAAIEAMGEPLDAMKVEGGIAIEESMFNSKDDIVFDAAAKCWRVMVQKALT